MLVDLLYFFILFSGAFALVLALGQLTVKRRTALHYFFFGLLTSVSLWLLASGSARYLYAHHYQRIYEFSVIITIIALFLTPPFLYLSFQTLLTDEFQYRKHYVALFLIPIFALVVACYTLRLPGVEIDYDPLWYFLIVAVGNVALVLLYILFSVVFYQYKSKVMKPVVTGGIVVVSLYLLLATGCWFFIGWHAGTLLTGVFIIIVYIFINRYPEFFQELQLASETVRYARSKLDNLDIDDVKKRLLRLFEKDKIFTDEELSLRKLALKLEVQAHQLSEILNREYKKNFNLFVNSYRIKEARKIMRQDRAGSIISIAYTVGFNSTSAFYAAFKNSTGQSPREYLAREQRSS
jgi:AraC-like DNA-binding protein